MGLCFRPFQMKLVPPISNETFERWAGSLQLPPYEKRLPVRPLHSRCQCGGPMWRVKERMLPDRVLVSCLDCRREWLSLERSG